MDIILASQSPRRRELLERMGMEGFQIVSPEVDEEIGAFPPAELVCRLSTLKAEAVRNQVGEGSLIIAADTVVALDGAVLGKPEDKLEAFKMLSALSGGRHQVYTGVTVLRGDEKYTEHEVTDVTFRELTEEEIEDYIKTGEPMDKAGAYGIQGYGALFIQSIQGDYYNVMGLPVCRLGQILDHMGVRCLHRAANRA